MLWVRIRVVGVGEVYSPAEVKADGQGSRIAYVQCRYSV